MKVITFNILTPYLCNSTDYIDYNPEHLDNMQRKTKIVSLLNEWISWEDQPIISLQEIPFSWKGDIERVLYSKNYRFFGMNYGNKKNGIFGVGICIPDKFKICKAEYILVGDHLTTNEAESIYFWESQNKQPHSLLENILSFITQESHINQINDILKEAKDRMNFLTRVLIQDEHDKKCFIYSYHMPCTFKKPIIQILHADALKKLISEHPNIPTILAADMNIKPDSSCYRYITKSDINQEDKIYLDWNTHSILQLQSSYKEINGEEPPFTCYCNTKYGGDFKDTLDYIFTSKNLKILESERLILTATKMPNEVCPSDHIPICSTIIHTD